jgi:3-hydroxymyristoyl/3-hydroxydecanoyl-(acyl carrier protein) dehydratase
VVLAGKLGQWEEQKQGDGGLDIALANAALVAGSPIHTMLSRATGLDLNTGIILEAELDPEVEPFLKDHALNGVPVLPGVIGIEGFAVAAKHVSSVLASEKAGFNVTRLENIQFLAPFKFYRNEPRRVTWKAQVVREDAGLVAHVTLESTLTRASQVEERMLHFTGRVYLEPQGEPGVAAQANPPDWNEAYTLKPADIYRLYFHGPAFQVLDGVQRSGELVLGKLRGGLPPLRRGGSAAASLPVLVELCLQTAGIWEAGTTGVLGLPCSIQSLKIYPRKVNGTPIFAEVTPLTGEDGALTFNARVLDAKGQIYLELENYRTCPLPYAVEGDLLRPLEALMGEYIWF